MPITQPRMIALINAATDYQQAFDFFTTAVRDAAARCRESPDNAHGELANLALMADPKEMLKRAVESAVTIALEHRHFKTHGARNRAEAKRQARRRGADERQTPAPKSLITPEDEARFAAQREADLQHDSKFTASFSDFVPAGHDVSTQSSIDAAVEAELAFSAKKGQ